MLQMRSSTCTCLRRLHLKLPWSASPATGCVGFTKQLYIRISAQ